MMAPVPISLVDSELMLAVQRLALLLARALGAFTFFPLGLELAPTLVRVSLAGCCAVALFPSAPPVTPGIYPLQLIAETVVGLCAGLCARLPLAAVEAGMQISSVSAGLGIASLLDPATEDEVHALTQLCNYAGLTIFFATGGHHLLLLALAEGLRLVPPGAATLSQESLLLAVQLGGALLSAAVQLAAPLIMTALALNLALGLLSRAAPTANIFAVNLVAVLLIGLLVILRGLPWLGPVLRQASAATAEHFLIFFRAAVPATPMGGP
jgi:flagellar biosynthetic protein FliR